MTNFQGAGNHGLRKIYGIASIYRWSEMSRYASVGTCKFYWDFLKKRRFYCQSWKFWELDPNILNKYTVRLQFLIGYFDVITLMYGKVFSNLFRYTWTFPWTVKVLILDHVGYIQDVFALMKGWAWESSWNFLVYWSIDIAKENQHCHLTVRVGAKYTCNMHECAITIFIGSAWDNSYYST